MIVFSIILYYLVIIPVSLLPFRVLYVFSDFLFLVLYRMIGYRTKVVRMNLKNSFPTKSDEDLKKIELLFYHHLCDVIVETVKSFTISGKEILKRMVVQNPELVNACYDEGRSVLLGGGHFNNWEWIATSFHQQIRHQAVALYTPLSNAFFEQKMRSTRGQFGLNLISTKLASRFFEENKDQLTATVFGIDQSPRNPDSSYWMNFLNQDTSVAFGLEKYAKAYNYPVFFSTIEKIKRGFYTVHFLPVTYQPQSEPPGRIIEAATRLLEEEIIRLPQYWLWTHKRWKHKRKL